MTTDEQKLEAIENLLKIGNWSTEINISYRLFAKEILESLKQFDPEPLEVQIKEFKKFWYVEYLRDDGFPRWLKSFYSEQECIDFCSKYRLRVKK